MRLLSLDLGITTGYAILSGGGAVLAYGELYNQRADPLQVKLMRLQDRSAITHVVAEKPLLVGQGQLSKDLEAVILNYKLVFPDAAEITPAQWKQTPFRAEPCPRGTSPHVKDAIRLGLYYLSTLKAS